MISPIFLQHYFAFQFPNLETFINDAIINSRVRSLPTQRRIFQDSKVFVADRLLFWILCSVVNNACSLTYITALCKMMSECHEEVNFDLWPKNRSQLMSLLKTVAELYEDIPGFVTCMFVCFFCVAFMFACFFCVAFISVYFFVLPLCLLAFFVLPLCVFAFYVLPLCSLTFSGGG